MKLMVVNSWKRYLNIALQMIRISLMEKMEHFAGILFLLLGVLLNLFISFAFFDILYLKVNVIAGWTKADVFMLLATFFMVQSIAEAFWVNGFTYLPYLVESGNLDLLLARPVSLRFLFCFYNVNFFTQIPLFAVSLSIIMYVLKNYNGQIFIFGYLITVLFSLLLHYCLTVLIYSINLKYIFRKGGWFLYEILNLGKYPIEVYKGVFRFFLSFIIPVSFMFSFPARAIYGKLILEDYIKLFVVIIIFFCLASFLWKIFLEKYESSNS